MRQSISLLLCTLFAASIAVPGIADPPPITQKSGPATATLDTVLASAAIPRDTCIIAVAPEQQSISRRDMINDLPAPGSSIDSIAPAFGMAVSQFGNVFACGPASMVVLNSDFKNPDLNANLDLTEAVECLMSSLDDDQWRLFTSKEGLGAADLKSEEQRFYFNASLPDKLQVEPRSMALEAAIGALQDVTDRADLRLRLGQTLEIRVPFSNGVNSEQVPDDPTGPARYSSIVNYSPHSNTEYGVALTQEQPNTLKTGDLDLASSAFDAEIPLKNLATVGDLVGAVSTATDTEIYADARYEKCLVRIYGDTAAISARNLLKSVAFCLTGAFREVGPAYLLSHNIIGSGAYASAVWNFENLVQFSKLHGLDGAAASITSHAKLRQLPFFEDPLALSSQQASLLNGTSAHAGNPNWQVSYPDHLWSMTLPMSDLTPGQKRQATQIYQKIVGEVAAHPALNSMGTPRPAGNAVLRGSSVISIISPSLGAPIIYDSVNVDRMFDQIPITPADLSKIREQLKSRADAPVPSLADAMKQSNVRAVYVHPAGIKELDNVIDAMGKLGFNQLWLDYFSGGRIQTLIADPNDASGQKVDLLNHAIARCKPLNIRVMAQASLFRWGNSAPEPALDLDILGESTRTYANRLQQFPPTAKWPDDVPIVQKSFDMRAVLDENWVSPFSKSVDDTLMGMMSDCLKHKGVGGVVLKDVFPDGRPAKYLLHASSLERVFGYGIDARLAFLRKTHVDPIDITEGLPASNEFPPSTSSRIYNEFGSDVYQSWEELQQKKSDELLTALAGMVRSEIPASTSETLYIKQNSFWRDPADTYSVSMPSGASVTSNKRGAMVAASAANAKPLPTVRVLPLQYIGDPAFTLSQLSVVPDEVVADQVALEQWMMDRNNIAPLTTRRLVDAIHTYVDPVRGAGLLLDLTAEGGVHDGVEELVRLAGEK